MVLARAAHAPPKELHLTCLLARRGCSDDQPCGFLPV